MEQSQLRKTFLAWAGTNSVLFVVVFFTVNLISGVARDPASATAAVWFSAIEATGLQRISEFSLDYEAFLHVLGRNSISAGAQFAAGLLGISPISIAILAAFYALAVFTKTSALTTTVAINDVILIVIESMVFLVVATLGSAISSQVFGIEPGFGRRWFRTVADASRANYRIRKHDFKSVVRANRLFLLIVFSVAVIGIVIGGWFEAVSY